jgi:NADH:ubiquinone oxidoreductase subunit F (NADH-binding)
VTVTMQTRTSHLLTAGHATSNGHLSAFGPLPDLRDARAIRRLIADAGLTGRGGAGFPTARKWDAVASGTRPIVIGNAAEGEPASHKDRTLLTAAPHLVLDGLALAGRAVGADELHLYLPAGSAPGVHAALAERPDLHISVHIAPDTFIAGEESAVIAAIAGGRAIPTDKAVRVTEHGLHGRPTLVQNVETLAHAAMIARYGPAWFRSRGTATEPGTFLATLSGPINRPGVYEIPYGTRLGDLLHAAGGARTALQALLIGGYHGAWIPPDPTIELSRDGLARYQATPGAGVIMAIPVGDCGLVTSARLITYLAGESAGQCGPCVNGLPRIADTFTALASLRPAPHLRTDIERLSRLVTGRGACKHPDGTARLVRSSLHAFAGEVSAHLAGWCTAATAGPERQK